MAAELHSEGYRAGLPSPGARLFAAAAFARPGQAAADIGCDHGKLAVTLAARPDCPKVVAVDNRPLPLAKAQALAGQTGLAHKVDCRLGWGLAPLGEGEAGDIFVAGLSGETIAEILAAAPWLRDADIRLVLVPSTRAPQLRRWLCEAGFRLEAETPVAEKGRFYTVICASFAGQPHTPAPLFCETGLLSPDDNAARGLLRSRLADLRKRRAAPLPPEKRTALDTLIAEVEQWLESKK